MVKLCIVDLDGVVADSSARFAKAEEVRQTAHKRVLTVSEANNLYWQTAFDPANVALDTLIDGVDNALRAIEAKGYTIIFLTSRPESMRGATESWLYWLLDHTVYDRDSDNLIMKAPAFQYTKTTVWKAGMVQTLAALYGATDILIVDDEQANIDEHLKYFSEVQTRYCYKSLAEVMEALK